VEREANYTAIGAFVLLVIGMAVAFVYWYSDARNSKSYQRYEVYFEGSVSGLNAGSTVRYLGVDVGRVVTLNIDRRSAARVQVIVDIDSATPIGEKTVAELSFLGVTGLLYIDLLGNAGNKKLTPPIEGERYPVIRSVRSGFDVFFSGLPEVMGRASEVAQRASRVLADENIEALGSTIDSLERSSRLLPATMGEVDALARELRQLTRDLTIVTQTMRTVTQESAPLVSQGIRKLDTAAENLASASKRLDQLLAENAEGITSFTQNGLPELEALLRESRGTSDELRQLARELREEPSRLLYEKAPQGLEVPR
jgi:phospholipid/cholesterol/gamma-HCH transport system substrate-binding protein